MLRGIFNELRKRNKALFWFGWTHVGLLLLAFVMYQFDHTVIMGINAWIKPMKFSISIAIYAWTFGWLLYYTTNKQAKTIITIGLIITMLVEVGLIYMQAFRGTTSHYNIYTAFDGIVFAAMGIFIGINSLINFYAIIVFFSKGVTVEGAALWAWRSGLALFFLGGISGGWMVSHMAHTVGAMDGGPGIPFLNWSTLAGDIRAAHFIALHGLQALPFATFLFSKILTKQSTTISYLFIALYTSACIYLHALAFLGLPVFAAPIP